METKTLVFEAFDTLFFREARPMESIGAKPLAGRFPPPPRTVAGAVRALAGEALKVDWRAYRNGDPSQAEIEKLIGKAKTDGLGRLALTGPYPVRNGERLYPAPLSLLAKPDGGYVRLKPGKPMDCDLGDRVRLPELEEAAPGAKPLENVWLTAKDMNAVLSGRFPKNPIRAGELFDDESRLGIALNHDRRSVEEGLLYQTVHARPREGTGFGVDVAGLPDGIGAGVIRLGGEGRYARVSSGRTPDTLKSCKPEGWSGVLLVLLTAARSEEGCWHPPGFARMTDEDSGAAVWRGCIEDIKLTIVSSVIGKPVREGGWDLANHQSRPAAALVPAGSVFFCTVADGDAAKAVEALQGRKIGRETEWGRGELAVGYWKGE
jgi:CRISPR-associated protein Cmr3